MLLNTFAYYTKPLRTIFRKDFYFHTSNVLYNYTYITDKLQAIYSN